MGAYGFAQYRRARVIVPLVVAFVAAGVVVAVSPSARADQNTISSDTTRDAWDSAEPNLSPSDVTASDFGQLFNQTVDGSVYAQPLVTGSTVLISTEKANVYALDAQTGAVKWTKNFGAPFEGASINCGDLTPDVGSTSTGVIDPTTGTYYFSTKIADGPDAQHPHVYLHAVAVADGTERPGWPVMIQGVAQNDPTSTFNAYTALQRPGLLLLGGVVYLAFGSHCDRGPYRGWVVGVSTSSAAITARWVTQAGSSSNGGGIWMSGSGLMSDGPGRIFLATGNGVSRDRRPRECASEQPRRVDRPPRREP